MCVTCAHTCVTCVHMYSSNGWQTGSLTARLNLLVVPDAYVCTCISVYIWVYPYSPTPTAPTAGKLVMAANGQLHLLAISEVGEASVLVPESGVCVCVCVYVCVYVCVCVCVCTGEGSV